MIENYRSLEKVELDDLGQFNVLIGKNNAGKSAILSAVRYVADAIFLPEHELRKESPLSHFANESTFAIEFEFASTDEDRRMWLSGWEKSAKVELRKDDYLKSGWGRKLLIRFIGDRDNPPHVILSHVELTDARGRWWRFMEKRDSARGQQWDVRMLNIEKILKDSKESIDWSSISTLKDYQTEAVVQVRQTNPNNWFPGTFFSPLGSVTAFFEKAFFFHASRSYDPRTMIEHSRRLKSDGSNLILEVHRLLTSEANKFASMCDLVHGVFPDIGNIETPVDTHWTPGNDRETTVSLRFRRKNDGISSIKLEHMGGGVAHVMMIALALADTTLDCPLFLEEPETNLHPGAQRYLAEELIANGRQVFVSTHSPTFLNFGAHVRAYKVTQNTRRTSVASIQGGEYGEALEDIGVRRSDMLMSDAIVFVEGESDKQVVEEWCSQEGIPLAASNTHILAMGSQGRVDISLRVRVDTLRQGTKEADIPVLFLLDPDERSPKEIAKIQGEFGTKVIFWQRREIENYLLNPNALREAIREKLGDDHENSGALAKLTDARITRLLKTTAQKLKRLVLVNRVRAQTPELSGGFFPRAVFDDWLEKGDKRSLEAWLIPRLQKRVANHLSGIDFKKLVTEEQRRLEQDWGRDGAYLCLAPGAELISAVFNTVSSEYEKTRDARRIACHVPVQKDGEIGRVLERIRMLTKQGTISA